MTSELAKLALQFMQRVQLQGAEVPAFNAVCASLREVAEKTACDTSQAPGGGDKSRTL